MKKVIKTIFTIIYIPFGLLILTGIAGIILAVLGLAELSDALYGVGVIIVATLIAIPIKKLEQKLTGEE